MQQHTTGPMIGGPTPFQMMQGIPSAAQMQPQTQSQMQSHQMMWMQGMGAQQTPYSTSATQMPGGGFSGPSSTGLGNNPGPSGSAFGFVSSTGKIGQPMMSAA